MKNLGGGDVPGLEEAWDIILTRGTPLYGIAVDGPGNRQRRRTMDAVPRADRASHRRRIQPRVVLLPSPAVPGLRLTTYQTTGAEMDGIGAGSVDFVFTFDVFVHLEPEVIERYLHEIERVLRPGGVAVLHYGDIRKDIARHNPGFSRMTRQKMEELIAATGLRVIDHDEMIMFHSNLVALSRE